MFRWSDAFVWHFIVSTNNCLEAWTAISQVFASDLRAFLSLLPRIDLDGYLEEENLKYYEGTKQRLIERGVKRI
jgi:hypothetical protein